MQFKWFCVIECIFMSVLLAFQASAYTDDIEAQTLREMYRAFNSPPQLIKWRLEGGDPCEELWTGVGCSGSSVVQIKLEGLNLTGILGFQISNLQHLKQLELSSNNIQGEIPHDLPHNLTHLILAWNNFSNSIPDSLTSLKHLQQLNLSHNMLSGPLGDFFGSMENLKLMDLSHNNFTGDLPSSFKALKNLTSLFMQSNSFTGSVINLSGLSLIDLNIEDNHFSGVIPENFQKIRNLWIGGNRFDRGGNYSPWNFPLDVVPSEKNISSPPTMQSSAIKKNISTSSSPPTMQSSTIAKNYASHTKGGEYKGKRYGSEALVAVVIGATLLAICAVLFIVVRIHRSRNQMLIGSVCTENCIRCLTKDCSSTVKEDSQFSSQISSPQLISPWQLQPVSRRSFANTCKVPICSRFYTISELQLATNNFSEENLLGEGSLGSVYKAEFPDGQIFAVKNINTVELSLQEEEHFLDVVRTASRLRHSNIVALSGYCVGYGQHLLVYEYVRSVSLQDALHDTGFIPLSWTLRLRIALGTARALNYLHSSCVPPIAHNNLKAANILLDEDNRPKISDCGLVNLRPLTTNAVKLKASEMAISDSGYVPPEHVQGGLGNTKADVYAFGVLLLELLTGKQPFDSSRPRYEQSLVEWASSRLDDKGCVAEMVDPAMSRTIPSKTLSRLAHFISLCIHPEKEMRPAMSEMVEWLTGVLNKQPGGGSRQAAEAGAVEGTERSFRTTSSCFFGSPRVN
ncbi:protein STRUBBELIG-RECEPTOR FAMILY 2 [Ipomoea triloba]|uniref:protein STRUBBELIG-RECEPTOR FAMILY 2 n=1 Tax=Ipomoea triloba TaxID=35885 RepID=UPI00125D036A|nr:protein STRUBBELIG-RECEPTOR FAMILY 2 [Ipomoea triloba]